MNFVQFKNSLRDFPVFSIADIRAAYGGFDRRRLSEWQKKGYIKKKLKVITSFLIQTLMKARCWQLRIKFTSHPTFPLRPRCPITG